MNWLEGLILGLLQGLTEFLPVSSSGHLEIGKVILGVDAERSMIFTIVVHGATVLSTIVVFWKEIIRLIKGFLLFRWNDETRYISMIALSMVPVGIVALFLKEELESLFDGNLVFVGTMLLVTAVLLTFSKLFRSKSVEKISFTHAFLIGCAQAVAVLPGVSRSGATIATGLILGNNREETAKFSFLMVLIPILGENFLSIISGKMTHNVEISGVVLICGFIAAFISGVLACRWMINIVKRGNLIWFAVYCFIIGVIAIGFGLS